MENSQEFANRRKKLLDQLGKNNAAILFSSPELIRNGSVHFPYRQDSDFYYFTGFSEPNAVAIFLPNRSEGEFILFNRARDPVMERWLGPRAGQEHACELFGADQAFDIKLLDTKLIELLAGRERIYYPLGKSSKKDRQVSKWCKQLQAQSPQSEPYPSHLSDISPLTAEMRLIKSKTELQFIKKACESSALAHCKLMEACRPGVNEYQLEALFDYEVKKRNCRFNAYGTIVAGGANACILHYVNNDQVLKDGELVLIDAGAEYENYAADITRTFPVNGKFTSHQAAIYQLVLETQLAVIKKVKPGIPWYSLQEAAVELLTKGLIALDIIKLPLKEALDQKLYQQYYMHTIGHWLGLDVHDVGAYKKKRQWRSLEPGMVLTIEPGLYLNPSNELDSKWWHIGVRIEDDVLVTDHGCEVLTEIVPKTIPEIEQKMSTVRLII